MKKISIVVMTILGSFFLVSCSSKSALEHFNKSDLEVKAFQESKKGDYLENGSPKVILWATFLNNVNKEIYKEKEEFLVSIYTSNSDKQGINELNYLFTLNDIKANSVKEISKNDDLINLVSKNNWGKYYLVSFDKTLEDNLSLKLLKSENELINLSFQKAH